MTTIIGKRTSYRPIAPSIAGVIPTITGEIKLDYTDGVGAETETFAATVTDSIDNWNSVPDMIFNIFPRTAREDLLTTGSEESIVYQGGVLTISGETFEDIDWLRSEITLVDWRSLNSLTFRAPRAYCILVEVEVNSSKINQVIGGNYPLEWTVDYGELYSLCSDPETDTLEFRVYWVDEAGLGNFPFSYTPSGTEAYLSSSLPVVLELDFYNTFETLEGTALSAGLGGLTAVGLSEFTAKGIEKMLEPTGILGQVAPHLLGMAAPIGTALGFIWLEGWITSLKDFESIIISLPAVAQAIALGTIGSVGKTLISKYAGVAGGLATAAGLAVDAGSKAVMTAVMIAALANLGFDFYPAGHLE